MKQSIAVALAIVSVVVFAPSAEASAVDPFQLKPEVKVIKTKKEKPKVPEIKTQAPAIKEHVVVEGDTLTTISQAYGLDWVRLWQKNTGLANPDILNIGDKLIIPTASEVLADRPLPVAPAQNTPPAPIQAPVRGVIPGNGYDYGYCTWHVKNMRPDLPNQLGDGNFWFDNAAAQGYPVGYVPQVGAVAAAVGYNHVAYVLAVDGNRVLVSEANYNGWNVISQRWSDTSEWRYIY